MNTRLTAALALSALMLASCGGGGGAARMGPDGKPLPVAYKISASEAGKITYRVLDSVNALRQAGGAAPLQLSAELNAAAATHSRDMSVQNRPWHFGSDGSSPIDRAKRAGYMGRVTGENISETFENDVDTLTAWMALPDTRSVIMDPAARSLGFAWFQEPSGKIWWTLLAGT